MREFRCMKPLRPFLPASLAASVLAAFIGQPASAQTGTTPEDPSQGSQGALVDKSLPAGDPSVGSMRFNGQTWEVSNSALFKARLEKFLSTPEETSEQEKAHRKTLNEIITLLDPNNLKPQTLSDAYRLLARAASYSGDSRLCDTLSGSIYAVWQSRRNQSRLAEANLILSEEKELARKNMASSANSPTPSSPIIQAGRASTIAENDLRMKANNVKSELSELQAKIQFQGLLVQLFTQRRFHHVIIGTRFYRALFSDGDSKLNLPNSPENPFSKGSGASPTVSNIESLANEAVKDVQSNVQAFHKFFELNEMNAASEKLRTALLVGEFMPEVRTLPFDRKRKVLGFIQRTDRLQSALESRDFATAQNLLEGPGGLKETAKDFDDTKARGAIETARNSTKLLLAKARNAANAGDKEGFETALKEAAGIWPNSPELQEVAEKAFARSDVANQAQMELDQLVAQKNYRRIAEDSGRFLAASQGASQPKQEQLKEVLDTFKTVETALLTAEALDREGNPAGAWETLDRIATQFPDDLPLSQARVLYTTKAAGFVHTLLMAREHERRTQQATSLAWYLKAQRIYPKSVLAEEAIARLKALLLNLPPG